MMKQNLSEDINDREFATSKKYTQVDYTGSISNNSPYGTVGSPSP